MLPPFRVYDAHGVSTCHNFSFFGFVGIFYCASHTMWFGNAFQALKIILFASFDLIFSISSFFGGEFLPCLSSCYNCSNFCKTICTYNPLDMSSNQQHMLVWKEIHYIIATWIIFHSTLIQTCLFDIFLLSIESMANSKICFE